VITAAGDRSARLVRWWARRYTAGLHPVTAASRRAEIDSDLAEHERFRRDAGWPTTRLSHERLRRTLAGVPADIGWRYDRLRHSTNRPGVTSVLGLVTTVAQLALAAYFFAFAAYLVGNTGLADQQVLGASVLASFEHYADEPGASTAASIIGAFGLVLALSALARSLSPIVSNAATIPIAMLAILFFWLGIWPLAVLVLVGAVADLALRAQHPALR
jgi:hypothetical protein